MYPTATLQRDGNDQPIQGNYSFLATKSIVFDGSDGAGQILTPASATLTADTILDGDTVTIDGVTYIFQTILVDEPNKVLIGVSDATALDNLKVAINAGAGEGTLYGTGTTAHPSVNATTNTDTTQVIEADTEGTAGNSLAVSSSGATLAWSNPTLTGGSDGTSDLFVVTGDVLAAVFARCSDDLEGASATIEVGDAGSTAALLAQSTATDVDEGDFWVDNAPDTIQPLPPMQLVSDDIIQTVDTANVTGGALEYYCFWRPLSEGANLIAA